MVRQCHRKAMKLAAYVTIHENSYLRADIILLFITLKTVKLTQNVQWT
jgi:hypothetical protein